VAMSTFGACILCCSSTTMVLRGVPSLLFGGWSFRSPLGAVGGGVLGVAVELPFQRCEHVGCN
jgi:hypothetical protein